jgi:quinol monooxygenase YgiN
MTRVYATAEVDYARRGMLWLLSDERVKERKGGNMVSLIAKIPVKEGKMEEATGAFKELMVHVAKEEGTLMYTVNRAQSDPNTLVIMERYKDKAALDAHSSSAYFKAFFASSRAFIAGKPEITVMEEIHSIR